VRLPETYVIGRGVLVPGRVARVLVGPGGLADYAQRSRGVDAEVDAVLAALLDEGMRWQRAARSRHGHSSGTPTARSSARGMSAAEAAEALGCSKRTVLRDIAAGRLPAERVGIGYVISHEDLEHRRAARNTGAA
jgi:excisionase family DNA binding protein